MRCPLISAMLLYTISHWLVHAFKENRLKHLDIFYIIIVNKDTFKYLHSCTRCLNAVWHGLCTICSDVCLTQCQRSDQQLLPPSTQRADHAAQQRYQTPCRRQGNKHTSANHNPSPSISPGNCRSAEAQRSRSRARHAIYFLTWAYFLSRERSV